MARRSLRVADVVEVLEHWAAGRPLRAIAESLGLDRNTVRKYITPAREAGFGPSSGGPPEGWAAFVARVCPRLGTAAILDPSVLGRVRAPHLLRCSRVHFRMTP